MKNVDLFDRALRPAAGALFVLLAACAGPSGRGDSEQTAAGADAPEPGRTIRVSARADGGDPVVCAEPRPACPAASGAAACLGQAGSEDLLRRGLFQICEGFRKGELSAEEYRAGLVAYSSLVAQIATLDFLDQPRFGGPRSAEARTVGGWLNANPALPALCRSLPAEQWLSAPTISSARLAALCLFRLTLSAKE